MLLCVCGVPANIMAFLLFLRRPKDLPTRIYLFTTSVDAITCLTVTPTGYSLLTQTRQPGIFGYELFCQMWGVLWVIIPFLSVFLVSVLSITRTIVLRNPLCKVKKSHITYTIVVYAVYLFLRIIIPIINGSAYFIFSESDVYCWEGKQVSLS